MATMFRIASSLIFSMAFLLASPGDAQEAAPWNHGLHSRTRLISGGMSGERWIAGIEIALDPGFKTYWRNPGESGLPPRFDWTGSENVAAVDIRWPAPSRHEDAGGVSYTYGEAVVLPVLVTGRDPTKPVRLSVAMDYGICKDICIPAHAALAATLGSDGPHRAAVERALAKVPRSQPLGERAEVSVAAIEPMGAGGDAFVVTVRAPEGARPVLFAEGPENWYLSTSLPDRDNRFVLTVEDRPKDAAGPVPVRLTLVAGGQAVETDASLDAGPTPR